MPLYVKKSAISSNDITSTGVFTTNINRDGLVLYYDGGSIDSNPGSGSTWYDLSGNGYHGTLTNGAYFSTQAYGGCVAFDGSNDYVETNSSTILPTGTLPFTIEAYYTMTTSTGGELFGNYGSSYTSGTVWFSGQYGVYINGSVYAAGAPLATGTRHMVSTRNADGFTYTYINGTLSSTGFLTTAISNSQYYRIGADVNGSSEPFGGYLYVLRVYNRFLNPSEIAENYLATKSRIGQ